MDSVKKLAVTLTLALAISGCQHQNMSAHKSDHEAHTAASHLDGDSSHHTNHMALPISKRLAFMSGHVAAGLALYRASEPEMAAPHLLHPVSETHAAERKGLDKLGFKGELFEAVSKALDEGKPSNDIEPQLLAAEQNLKELAETVGGDPADIIEYLMDTVLEEYQIGVTGSNVTDAGEYQDAFGFTKVAIDRAASLSGDRQRNTQIALDALLRNWPTEGPVPPESAATITQIRRHVILVKAALKM
ncbi:MAG: hypothetical protein AB8G18_04130 [Gammaproteobacteria bacterium]